MMNVESDRREIEVKVGQDRERLRKRQKERVKIQNVIEETLKGE